MKNIVLFASGSGTNVENCIRYFKNSTVAKVAAVFSNNPNAQVLEKAKKNEIPAVVFQKEALSSEELLLKIKGFKPDLIVLAGFLLRFPENIIAAYPNKIINIHPALLPKYGGKGMYGMNVHRAVIENKETETGITIHFVNEQYDEGNVIFQKSVSLTGKESAEDVAEKVHELEQTHFPLIIEKLINQDLTPKTI